MHNEKILFLEDENSSRSIGEKAIRKGGHHFISPQNIDELHNIINKKDFTKVVIDYNLSKWVGSTNNNPINIFGTECFDGIQIARQLLKIKKRLTIGLYSSYEQKIEEKLKSEDEIYDIHLIKKQLSKPLFASFSPFLNKYKSKTFQVTEHFDRINYDETAKIYFNLKLKDADENSLSIIKCGSLSWSIDDSFNDNHAKYISEKSKSYSFEINTNTNNISRIIDNKTNISNSENKLFDLFTRPINNSNETKELIFSYPIIEQFIQNNFKSNKDKIVELSSHLINHKSLFFSKEIFKTVCGLKYENTKVNIKKEIENLKLSNQPKILEIFKGRVESVDENVGTVKLNSISNPDIIRIEQIKQSSISRSHLELDSEFEYTIYNPVVGGIASHFQPI